MTTRLQEEDVSRILKKGHVRLADGDVLSESIKRTIRKSRRVQSHKIKKDTHAFDSKIEADIYYEFKFDPDIEILELQPKFILLSPFKRKNKSYRGVTYTPDFKVRIKGFEWIVEVKSIGTLKANSKSYPIRRKLFLHKFPELNFREIIFDGKQRTEKDY